jgi:transcriptional regulator with XRE-family HTH domain
MNEASLAVMSGHVLIDEMNDSRQLYDSRGDLRIAETLLELRHERSLSQQELARRAGISASLISQIENNAITPSIETLCRIADALDVKVRGFFENEQTAVVVRNRDRKRITSETDGFSYETLAYCPRDLKMLPSVITLLPGSVCGYERNIKSGAEFAYVLSGKATFTFSGQARHMEAGDSVCYRADMPHQWGNPFEENVEFLCVNTPAFK